MTCPHANTYAQWSEPRTETRCKDCGHTLEVSDVAAQFDAEATLCRGRANLCRERGNMEHAGYQDGRAEALRWAAEMVRRDGATPTHPRFDDLWGSASNMPSCQECGQKHAGVFCEQSESAERPERE